LKKLVGLSIGLLVWCVYVSGNNRVYPNTFLVKLDTLSNSSYQYNCNENQFNGLIEDYSYAVTRSLIPLEEAKDYLIFIRRILKQRPEFSGYSYLVDLSESMILFHCKDSIGFDKFTKAVDTKLTREGMIGKLIQYELGLANFLSYVGFDSLAILRYHKVESIVTHYGLKNLDEIGRAFSIVNANALAINFKDKYLIDSALHYFNIGLARANILNNQAWQGILSGNIAMLKVRNGDRIEAEELLLKDYKNSLESKQIGSAINATLGLIDLKILEGNLISAQHLYDTAYRLIGLVDTLKKEEVSSFYNKLRLREIKIKALLRVDEVVLNYIDSIHDVLRKEKGKDQNTDRYFIEDNAAKLVSLREERERNLFILGVFSLLIVLGVVMVFLQRRYNKILSSKNEEIAKQAQNLELLNQHKNKLFSIVAHDVRGPIGVLSKLLELYKENDITEDELIKYSSQVGDTLGSLNVMLDNLLNWARSSMENGLAPRMVEVNISNISNDIIKQLQPQINLKGIEVNIKNQAKGILIETDPAFLTVIIRNLLSNAIKYTQPNTQIGMHILLDEKENKVEISISDKGLGLSEQAIQEILQSNTGVMSKPGTKGELGSGIGLMLCKEFTKALGGQLSAQSQLNVGTTFKVSLPIR
jgi:signal transduction histidine kinase